MEFKKKVFPIRISKTSSEIKWVAGWSNEDESIYFYQYKKWYAIDPATGLRIDDCGTNTRKDCAELCKSIEPSIAKARAAEWYPALAEEFKKLVEENPMVEDEVITNTKKSSSGTSGGSSKFKRVTFPVAIVHRVGIGMKEMVIFVDGWSNADGTIYFTKDERCRAVDKIWSATDPETGMALYHGKTRTECVQWCEENAKRIEEKRNSEQYKKWKERLQRLVKEAKEKEKESATQS